MGGEGDEGTRSEMRLLRLKCACLVRVRGPDDSTRWRSDAQYPSPVSQSLDHHSPLKRGGEARRAGSAKSVQLGTPWWLVTMR